jgi:phosphonate degradation associated HDIG domain protein
LIDKHNSIATTESAHDTVDRIFDLFRKRGDAAYIGEPVSQTEHALQAAAAAERAGASSAMITAALLHDFGHLLHDLPEDCADDDIDDRHEELGARWLVQYFGPDVTEPMRLHVAAKRFLCATSPSYHARLSPASIKSLELQGGAFSPAETQTFRQNRYALAAVALRGWDEEAKVKGMETPGLEHFRPHLEATIRTTGS